MYTLKVNEIMEHFVKQKKTWGLIGRNVYQKQFFFHWLQVSF